MEVNEFADKVCGLFSLLIKMMIFDFMWSVTIIKAGLNNELYGNNKAVL